MLSVPDTCMSHLAVVAFIRQLDATVVTSVTTLPPHKVSIET